MPAVPDNGPYPWEQVPDLTKRETKYLVFRELKVKTKTRQWAVLSKNHDDTLGRIHWYGQWRQFVFTPTPGTLFNIGCLMDINSFLTDALTDWRLARARTST